MELLYNINMKPLPFSLHVKQFLALCCPSIRCLTCNMGPERKSETMLHDDCVSERVTLAWTLSGDTDLLFYVYIVPFCYNGAIFS